MHRGHSQLALTRAWARNGLHMLCSTLYSGHRVQRRFVWPAVDVRARGDRQRWDTTDTRRAEERPRQERE
jgi:hypothetical protein